LVAMAGELEKDASGKSAADGDRMRAMAGIFRKVGAR
jgi:hypothetical protein